LPWGRSIVARLNVNFPRCKTEGLFSICSFLKSIASGGRNTLASANALHCVHSPCLSTRPSGNYLGCFGSAVPNFRIPLRHTDADIVLRLQPLLDDCYRRGRYASIDYSQPPRPKLDDKAASWAAELIVTRKQWAARGSALE